MASASVEAGAASTALCAVPLPRCAREEERGGARANAADGGVARANRFHYNAESLS
jgi:hypothetical protein